MTAPQHSPMEQALHGLQSHLGDVTVMVTMLVDDRWLLLAGGGPKENLEELASLEAAYSICPHAAAKKSTLAIDDTRAHPQVRGSKAVSEFGVAAYLGVPIYVAGDVAAIVCAFDYQARTWAPKDISSIEEAAGRVAETLIAGVVAGEDQLPIIARSA